MKKDSGLPFALGAAGLLAAAGLLRQRGSQASNPKARMQHYRRLLEPGSGAAEAERQFARRALAEAEAAEREQAREGRSPGGPPRPQSAQSAPREMKRGPHVGPWFNGRGYERYNIVMDGVPNGGGYLVNRPLAIMEFDRTVGEMMATGRYNKVELRARVPGIQGQIDPREDHLLMNVKWQRHDKLDSLFDKIFLLMMLDKRSLWTDGLDPRDRGGPFILNGTKAWEQALRVLVELHPFRSWSDRICDISWVHPFTLGLVREADPKRNELWPMQRVLKPGKSRQTWAVAFMDHDDPNNNRMLHLGSNPLMLYEAIENIKREMPGRRFWVDLIQSYTVRYADRVEPGSLPGPSAAPGSTPSAVVHTLLPAPVLVFRERIEAIRDKCQRNDLLLETMSWDDVLRLIDNEAEYQGWFDEAAKRHKMTMAGGDD